MDVLVGAQTMIAAAVPPKRIDKLFLVVKVRRGDIL